ncbi:hypothetical protein [Kordiimonas lacus]|uniref:Uncharacterized protein n=1 Tax=Kordiimonas lacus TaxID=637679 RepID=A0A1G7C864_9PROT|nr:hypothetical protein [Kordiimonas lacus]SDE34625.1 hypothetical protein SAMN04488071_2667 [Kordiimonas lacus]
MIARLKRVTHPYDQIFFELNLGSAVRIEDPQSFDVEGTWGVLEDYQVVGFVGLEDKTHVIHGGQYFAVTGCAVRDDLDQFWLGLLAVLRLRKGRLELALTPEEGDQIVLTDNALHQRFEFLEDDHSHIFHHIDFVMNHLQRTQEALRKLRS